MAETGGFTSMRQRPRPGLIVLIVALHVLALYGLTRAFAPDAVAAVEESVVEAFTVIVTSPEEPPEPEPDAGAAGEQGREATPREVTAPEPPVPVARPTPVPRALSTGAADTSGARDSGAGTGAAGAGSGTGSGQGGAGSGGGSPGFASVCKRCHAPGDQPQPSPSQNRSSAHAPQPANVATITAKLKVLQPTTAHRENTTTCPNDGAAKRAKPTIRRRKSLARFIRARPHELA